MTLHALSIMTGICQYTYKAPSSSCLIYGGFRACHNCYTPLAHSCLCKHSPMLQVAVERAAKLLGRLAYNRTIKDSVRDASGIGSLLKLLSVERGAKLDARMAETVVVALTVLAVNNELNQDTIRCAGGRRCPCTSPVSHSKLQCARWCTFVHGPWTSVRMPAPRQFMRSGTLRRDEYGVAPIVKLLEGHQGPPVTSAALDAVRAMSLNNDANKNALREAWVLPQLVKLLAQVCHASLKPEV